MKILHIITSLHTGGAETLVVNMLPRFVALGHEVGLVVFNGERTALTERLERECPECKLYALGTGYYNPTYILKLIKIMRQYDVIHTHNSSPQLFAAIANCFAKKKLVTTEHNTNNRKRGNWLLAKIDRWMYTRYDKIICISDKAEENLREYLNENGKANISHTEITENAEKKRHADHADYLTTDCTNDTDFYNENEKVNENGNGKIITIYNGVEVEAIHQAKPLDGEKPSRFVVVMVAAFRPQKDQDTLIKAMSLLPKDRFELWLVGDGERRNCLEELVVRHNLTDNVRLLGLRTDVPRILKTADVVVMSTHYEGLSLSNIEGMSSGKPFVASDVDGIHEVTDGYGILVPHEDAEALAGVIKRLAEDKAYYDEVAKRCYQRARQFDIAEMVERYNTAYSNS